MFSFTSHTRHKLDHIRDLCPCHSIGCAQTIEKLKILTFSWRLRGLTCVKHVYSGDAECRLQSVNNVVAGLCQPDRRLEQLRTLQVSLRRFLLSLRHAWRPSVRPSVTLVDCDHTVQQQVEVGTSQDRSVSWLSAAKADPDRSILWSGILKNVEFCTRGGVQRLACCAISASAELRVIDAAVFIQ